MNSRRTHRRQFLKGQSATEAIADLAAGAVAEPGTRAEAPPPESYLVQFGRRAMACQFEVFLNAGQHPGAADAAVGALELIDELEAQLTVYRETSEVAEINRRAVHAPVAVEQRLFELLSHAVELSRQTEGAFDITSGPLTKVWGFHRRSGALPPQEELAAALTRVGSQFVTLDATTRTVQFQKPDMELNLGAIGKGYALDRVAEELSAAGIGDFLCHGGQSSVLARGSCGIAVGSPEAAGTGGWVVDLRHPLRPERSVVEVRLRDRALGTSGAGTQFFRHQGRRYGHILDPRTGWPGEGVFSATVVAPTAADADALSTALYLLGPERAVAWRAAHPEVGLLMFVPGEAGRSVELIAEGLSADDWRITGDSGVPHRRYMG
jgi:FAD:protein FMN transferase